MKQIVFASMAMMVIALSSVFAQSQTQVGHLSGGTPVFDVTPATFIGYMELDVIANGATITSVTIEGSGNAYYLVGRGTLSGNSVSCAWKLSKDGAGNFQIAMAGGKSHRCQGNPCSACDFLTAQDDSIIGCDCLLKKESTDECNHTVVQDEDGKIGNSNSYFF